jgi:hypothetical protein
MSCSYIGIGVDIQRKPYQQFQAAWLGSSALITV